MDFLNRILQHHDRRLRRIYVAPRSILVRRKTKGIEETEKARWKTKGTEENERHGGNRKARRKTKGTNSYVPAGCVGYWLRRKGERRQPKRAPTPSLGTSADAPPLALRIGACRGAYSRVPRSKWGLFWSERLFRIPGLLFLRRFTPSAPASCAGPLFGRLCVLNFRVDS